MQAFCPGEHLWPWISPQLSAERVRESTLKIELHEEAEEKQAMSRRVQEIMQLTQLLLLIFYRLPET